MSLPCLYPWPPFHLPQLHSIRETYAPPRTNPHDVPVLDLKKASGQALLFPALPTAALLLAVSVSMVVALTVTVDMVGGRSGGATRARRRWAAHAKGTAGGGKWHGMAPRSYMSVYMSMIT